MSAAGSDDDLLVELDKDLDEGEKTGDAVADSLANIVNKSFRRKLSEDKLKERFDKYLRPSNCAALQVPLVNKEIWRTMSADARKADIKASHVQKHSNTESKKTNKTKKQQQSEQASFRQCQCVKKSIIQV